MLALTNGGIENPLRILLFVFMLPVTGIVECIAPIPITFGPGPLVTLPVMLEFIWVTSSCCVLIPYMVFHPAGFCGGVFPPGICPWCPLGTLLLVVFCAFVSSKGSVLLVNLPGKVGWDNGACGFPQNGSRNGLPPIFLSSVSSIGSSFIWVSTVPGPIISSHGVGIPSIISIP